MLGKLPGVCGLVIAVVEAVALECFSPSIAKAVGTIPFLPHQDGVHGILHRLFSFCFVYAMTWFVYESMNERSYHRQQIDIEVLTTNFFKSNDLLFADLSILLL